MRQRFVTPLVLALALGFAGTLAACKISGDAKFGNQPPPPAAPPPAPVAAPAPAPPPVVAVANAKVEGNRVKIPGELEFDVDKATLRESAQSTQILATLIEFMKQNPHVTKLRIEGHTDNTGSVPHNQTLSQERAEAVAKYLEAHGVDKARLSPEGFGATKPLAINDTPEHKAENRRTEFHVAAINGNEIK